MHETSKRNLMAAVCGDVLTAIATLNNRMQEDWLSGQMSRPAFSVNLIAEVTNGLPPWLVVATLNVLECEGFVRQSNSELGTWELVRK